MDSYQSEYADLPPNLNHFISRLQLSVGRKWKSELDLNDHNYIDTTLSKTENILLADLGFGNQAPDFSQSEFDLRNQQKEKKRSGVRFLSQERNSLVGTNDCDGKNASGWTLSCSYNDVTCSTFSIEVTEDCGEGYDAGYRSNSSLSKGSLHNSLPSLIRRGVEVSKFASSSEDLRNDISLNGNLMVPSRSLCLTPRIKRKQLQSLKRGLLHDTSGPFVPSSHADLPLGCRIKVIHVSGQVLSGWVRYIGPLPGLSEIQLGVELATPGLGGDGSYDSSQIFTWLDAKYLTNLRAVAESVLLNKTLFDSKLSPSPQFRHCGENEETLQHILFQCRSTSPMTSQLKILCNELKIPSLISSITSTIFPKKIEHQIYQVLVSAILEKKMYQ